MFQLVRVDSASYRYHVVEDNGLPDEPLTAFIEEQRQCLAEGSVVFVRARTARFFELVSVGPHRGTEWLDVVRIKQGDPAVGPAVSHRCRKLQDLAASGPARPESSVCEPDVGNTH